MPNFPPLRLFLARVAFYGLSLVLAGFVWAWALDANIWYGVVPGAVLGLVAVLAFGFGNYEESEAAGGFAPLAELLATVLR